MCLMPFEALERFRQTDAFKKNDVMGINSSFLSSRLNERSGGGSLHGFGIASMGIVAHIREPSLCNISEVLHAILPNIDVDFLYTDRLHAGDKNRGAHS